MVALLVLPLACTHGGTTDPPGAVDDSGDSASPQAVQVLIANQSSDRLELYDLADPTAELAEPAWRSPVISGLSEGKHVTYLGQDAVLATTDNGAIVYSYPDGTLLFHRETADSTLEVAADFGFDADYDRCALYDECDESGAWEDGGHDLNRVAGSDSTLWLTTGEHAFLFDMDANPVSGPGRTAAVLERYTPMYALDSTISQRVAPTAEADHLVLQKGGLKAISGDPSTEPDDQLDVDLSEQNHLALPGGMRFYKARIF